MPIFGNSQKYPDDSAESFIEDNLSAYCVLWLTRQSEALGESRAMILQNILKEWFATHVEMFLIIATRISLKSRGKLYPSSSCVTGRNLYR